ncbi:hypothetical protein [Kushneria konosiri]|uniref:Uncharacterized protein n=1 Tax=Kushneria konosiri TaxID=698828 RepID=A0A2Z2H5X0_9GAMM|nr:hypothetical protein [Kushneria konosiri]ARS52734.1 hypothetical protein B9G99_07480 [Kushneria konosiri]
MRPLDILSITLVLCAVALVMVLPMSNNEATLSSDTSLTSRSTLHYPGQQRQETALLQFDGHQGQSRPMLFDLDQAEQQDMPPSGSLFGPETPAPSMSMRYPNGRQIYSF